MVMIDFFQKTSTMITQSRRRQYGHAKDGVHGVAAMTSVSAELRSPAACYRVAAPQLTKDLSTMIFRKP